MDSDDDYLYDATDSGNESPEGEESDGEQVSDNSDEDNEDVTDATAQDDDFGMDIGLGKNQTVALDLRWRMSFSLR